MAGRKMTPKGQMAFGGGPPITHLPPAMKAMFQPGPPLPFRPQPKQKKPPPYSGLAAWTDLFEKTEPPERIIQETPRDRREDRLRARKAAMAAKLADAKDAWDPHRPRRAAADLTTKEPYKTLFVGRLSYDTTEAKLKREFEQYGKIKSLRLVYDKVPRNRDRDAAEKNGDLEEGEDDGYADDDDDVPPKSRGYAFIEFEKEDAMRDAYKRADGKKLDGRRILVDVERGRTVRKWKPRRLGGGLGGRAAKPKGSLAPSSSTGGVVASTTSAYRPPSSTAPPPSYRTGSSYAPSSRSPPRGAASRYTDRSRSRERRDRDRDRRDRDREYRDREYRDRDRARHRDDRDRGRDGDRDRSRARRDRSRSRSRDRSRRY